MEDIEQRLLVLSHLYITLYIIQVAELLQFHLKTGELKLRYLLLHWVSSTQDVLAPAQSCANRLVLRSTRKHNECRQKRLERAAYQNHRNPSL